MGTRNLAIGVAIAAALLLPAGAAAKTVTYSGIGKDASAVQVNVEVKDGKPTKVSAVYGVNFLMHCPETGNYLGGFFLDKKTTTDLPKSMPTKVDGKGKFEYTVKQDFDSYVSGKATTKKVSGEYRVHLLFPATDTLPEEECDSHVIKFKAFKGGYPILPNGLSNRLITRQTP